MNLNNKKCGECGHQGYERRNLKGKGAFPWKDFPVVYLTQDLELWVCGKCGNRAVLRGDSQKTDEALEASVRDQISQFIDIIKSKSGLSLEEISHKTGISYTYLSTLRNKKRTPSFQVWNYLKMIAGKPKEMLELADPGRDIRKENLLLRA